MSLLVRGRTRSPGQAVAEFAIVIPLFLVFLMGVFDLGRVIWANSSLASAAREAARYAIVHGGSASNTCPVGNATGTEVVIPPASSTCPYPSPSKQSIYDAAINAAIAGGAPVNVTVCYATSSTTCTGDVDTSNNAKGNTVTVRITSTVNLVTPALLGWSQFQVGATSTMVINH